MGRLPVTLEAAGSGPDFLADAAKRYRVDVEKLQKAVAAEFAAKKDRRKAKAKSQPVTE